jgi:nicotinate-nucleotide pyrophosphorylase (carboxylating)
MHLGEMILVKNNHIDACGSVDALFECLYAAKPWYMPVECEVRTLEELGAVLKHRPQILMLDNMSNETIALAMGLIEQADYPVLVEFSGGLTRERLDVLSQYVGAAASMGALTTQATNVDISMRIVASVGASV